MQVHELWRYPVKSLQGERLDAARLTGHGLEGDRRWALFDVRTGVGLTARRVPELLFASARLSPGGTVVVTLPDGSTARDDRALSRWLGREVQLRSADAPGPRRFESPTDDEDQSAAWSYDGSPGAFHDDDVARVSLVTTTSAAGWDPRRFRSNVVLDGQDEDALVGAQVVLGGARLAVEMSIPRCVMVTRPQPGLDKDLTVLRTLHRTRDGCLAVGATVLSPGVVRVGDALRPATEPAGEGVQRR